MQQTTACTLCRPAYRSKFTAPSRGLPATARISCCLSQFSVDLSRLYFQVGSSHILSKSSTLVDLARFQVEVGSDLMRRVTPRSRLRRPSPDPTPFGTLALRASRASLGTFGPSIIWRREIFGPLANTSGSATVIFVPAVVQKAVRKRQEPSCTVRSHRDRQEPSGAD